MVDFGKEKISLAKECCKRAIFYWRQKFWYEAAKTDHGWGKEGVEFFYIDQLFTHKKKKYLNSSN